MLVRNLMTAIFFGLAIFIMVMAKVMGSEVPETSPADIITVKEEKELIKAPSLFELKKVVQNYDIQEKEPGI